MNQSEAEQVYLYHLERTEELIHSMGNNPQAINAFITNTYSSLYDKHPAFLWFSLGTIVSGTVGQNLQVAKETIIHSLGQAESAKIVLDSFEEGNQAIFKNILPLFLTYDSIGEEGIKLLANSEIKNPFKNKDTLDAMIEYSKLQTEQSTIANSLGLPLNDPSVIEKLFSEQQNIILAHTTAMGIAIEEQEAVQKIYEDDLVNVLLDPALGWAGHQLKLDDIKILDKEYNFFDYIDNPADLEQRLSFAEVLLAAIEEGINNGELLKHQANVIQMADKSLWMASPYTASNLLGDVNGAYWGQLADEHDKEVKDSVLAFLNPGHSAQERIVSNPVSYDDENIFAEFFSGEYEIVQISVDPLALFLANNPNYAVIANSITELLDSHNYFRVPVSGGTVLWHTDIPYLSDSTYIALYDDGIYHYHQPYGEVRGIVFPFMYDTTTGTPLTMPINDLAKGDYDHTSTLESIYNNPEVFNTPGHINWYNPYWYALNYEVALQSQAQATYNYLKFITVDNFMNAVLAPQSVDISYNYGQIQIELNSNDIFLNNSNEINLSSFSENSSGTEYRLTVELTAVTLRNGMRFEIGDNGEFSCVNSSGGNVAQYEHAMNAAYNSSYIEQFENKINDNMH